MPYGFLLLYNTISFYLPYKQESHLPFYLGAREGGFSVIKAPIKAKFYIIFALINTEYLL